MNVGDVKEPYHKNNGLERPGKTPGLTLKEYIGSFKSVVVQLF